MQNSRTSNDFIHKTSFFGFLTGLAIVGVLFGVMSYCFMSAEFLKQLSIAERSYIELRQNQDFSQILIKSFAGSSIYLGCALILGFSAISQPIEIIIPLVKGLGLGVCLAQIYAQNGKEGILTGLLLILPCALISMYALIIGVRESIGLSNILLSNMLTVGQTNGLLSTVKLYGTKFLVLEAMTAVSAAVDCVCAVVFSGRL